MKSIYLLILLPVLASCSSDIFDHPQDNVSLGQLGISLTGIDGDEQAGFDIQLRNVTTNSQFSAQTQADGKAVFNVTPGIYEASASAQRSAEGFAYIYNGTSGQITVRSGQQTQVSIDVKRAKTSQLVIKELYNGGCLADDGVTKFQFDKGIVLYNNSALPASLSNLCFGFAAPYNSQANNKNYNANGHLTYENEGFIPALNGIWYFPSTLEIAPYSQVVVSVFGAIDNTQTISASVNYAHEEYYCMYDPESGYNNTSYYPTPSSIIPTSHYLKAVRLGLGNAWALSVLSPALYVFQTKGVAPLEYATNTANHWYDGGQITQSNICLKVPDEWVVDAIEVFAAGYKDSSLKRLTADIDAGFVWLTNYQGHSLYRNVDQAATEALPENKGRLVYDYALGVDASTDPSGIDAEASIKQGAHIVYMDTNNATNDFHERQRCSLRN